MLFWISKIMFFGIGLAACVVFLFWWAWEVANTFMWDLYRRVYDAFI